MKRKGFFIVILLIVATVTPLFIFGVQATLSAGPDQQVYSGQTAQFNGTTTDNSSLITQVTWDFGDNSSIVNGTSPSLLNETHVYSTTGVYNATLTVSFGGSLNKTDTAQATITVVENLPPIADAGPDQFVNQTSVQGANVTLSGTGSSDPNDDILSYSWSWAGGSATGATPTVLFPPGNTTVTLMVSDGLLNATDTVNIVVQDITPPFANAGPDVTAEQESHAGTQIILNGTATDDISTRFNFTWSEEGVELATATNATNTTLNYTFNLGVHTVILMATDDAGNIGSDAAIVTIVDTIPPVVDAGPDLIVEPQSPAETQIMLNGTATDICSERFNFTWSENGVVLASSTNVTNTTLTQTFSLGTHLIMLNATDAAGNTGTTNVTIKIIDTTPPIVSISPQNVTAEAGTPVNLNGTATDNLSTRFNFTWSENGTVLKTQANATNTSLAYITKFNVGVHIVTLNATDEAGNTGTSNVTITVVDTTPPTITATVMPGTLWPPNHKYAEVKTNVTAVDLGDPVPKITFMSITSNEPDNSKGDGNTVDDIVIVNDYTFNLRSERSGSGSGRIYTITYKATDASGNYAIGTVIIEVPHNQ